MINVFFLSLSSSGQSANHFRRTCHSIHVQWISPLDENGVPYRVRIDVSYKDKDQTKAGTILVPSAKNKLNFFGISSDVRVKLSLAAINKRLKEGPSVKTTIRTKKSC